jgi:hypothetical protein
MHVRARHLGALHLAMQAARVTNGSSTSTHARMDLQAIPLDRRARALSHLGTAYAILLANHGQASTLLARKAVDTIDSPFLPGLNLMRDNTREQSGHVSSRIAEAQAFLFHACDELGVARPAAEHVKTISTAEQYFDCVFTDLMATHRARTALNTNQTLADRVRGAYNAVRESDPALASAKPLEAMENEPRQALMDGLGEAMGFAGGSFQFWSTGKWVMVIGMLLVPVAFIALLVYANAVH